MFNYLFLRFWIIIIIIRGHIFNVVEKDKNIIVFILVLLLYRLLSISIMVDDLEILEIIMKNFLNFLDELFANEKSNIVVNFVAEFHIDLLKI